MLVRAPLEIGPSTISYMWPVESGGGDVESLDLATAKIARLGPHANPADTLLNVRAGRLTFVSGANHIVTESGEGAPVTIELPTVGN